MVTNELSETPEYRNTMAQLEAAKRIAENGAEYWLAREIHELLGYHVWDKFEPVLDRARESLRSNGIEPSHHIAQTSKMMGIGRGGTREGVDFFLSRPACSLIAMNGDPTKPEIAACQAYFVVQTRRMEIEDQLADDERRLDLRDRVAKSFRAVSGVASAAGVRSQMQGIFHDARYQGLYGSGARDVKARKGLGPKDNLFDYAGAFELSANEFQMNLAADVIDREGIRGEQAAIRKNKELATDVRQLMKRRGATMPEDLVALVEPIVEVKKRVRQQKKLSGPSAS